MDSLTYQPNNEQPLVTIHIGSGCFMQIAELIDLKQYTKICVVTDEHVKPLLLTPLLKQLPRKTPSITVRSDDDHKTIESVQDVWRALHAADCDRRSLVINLGGGLVGDVGGFAASTYMRGIDFINIPTTLLAQVDASVGGKTGCNFDGIKNLIGTFSQPQMVIIDPELLKTLPDRAFTAGFGEIIKHGLIKDKSYFEHVTSQKPRTFSSQELVGIIKRSCEIKRDIVAADTEEHGQRKLVNFGHTIGHALESLSLHTPRPLLHGEAVSIGMVAEASLSMAGGRLGTAQVTHIKHALIASGLPVSYSPFSLDDALLKMSSDKKNTAGSINFTLLDTIGSARVDQHADESAIRAALESVRQ